MGTLFGPFTYVCVQSKALKCGNPVFRKTDRFSILNSTWTVQNLLNNLDTWHTYCHCKGTWMLETRCALSCSILCPSFSPPLFAGSFAGSFENTIVPYQQPPKLHFTNTVVSYQLPCWKTWLWDCQEMHVHFQIFHNAGIAIQQIRMYLLYDIQIHTYRHRFCSTH